ncbi:MAG: RNA repair transcriptional activator RtcR family protein [Melioribacteraceae bacterium]|nr:MAG: RNA repair transcriptional activator RtcR family protein [Melioribacteraceae bacterium]
MIYFSFIGNHDKVIGNEYGSFLNIYKHFSKEIKSVFSFITPNTPTTNYEEIAKGNFERIKEINPKIEIVPIYIDLKNPIDYDLVYPILFDEYLQINKKYKIENNEKFVNITSGTPTMTACWILLTQSRVISNARLFQSFEKRFARDGKTIQEVNLSIDDFPSISVPDETKRKLTIATRKQKELEDQLYIEKLNEEFKGIIGKSKQILSIKDRLLNDVNNQTNVLITGERGTGKEVVAKEIWKRYHSENDPELIPFDCGGFNQNLIESELFGHVKGAFTGADQDKVGILEKYNDRMIFLDEIGNLPKEGQQKLLRVLEHGELRRLGSTEVTQVNLQIIAATNKDINDEDIFAADVKDRFDEIIELPPLRERKSDIPLLIDHFLEFYSKTNNVLSPLEFDDKLIRTLTEYSWESNVRGLEKFIQRLTRRFTKGGKIKLDDLPEHFISDIMDDESLEYTLPELPLPIPLDEYTRMIIEKARKQASNMSEVDRLLKQKDGAERARIHRSKN